MDLFIDSDFAVTSQLCYSYAMHWREKLRMLLRSANAAELSRRAGLNPSAISGAASKGNMPKADKAIKIAKSLNVSVEWLFDDDAPWPPSAVSTPALGDTALVDELIERRQQVAQDIRRIAERLSERSAQKRAEELAKACWDPGGYAKLSHEDQAATRAFYWDMCRLRTLWQRFDMLDPERVAPLGPLPTGEAIFASCPHLLRQYTDTAHENPHLIGQNYTPGSIVPVSVRIGEVISAEQYATLDRPLSNHFIPLLTDTVLEDGPLQTGPAKSFEEQREQAARLEQCSFVRFDRVGDGVFGYRIDQDSRDPDFPAGGIIVCEPATTPIESNRPYLVYVKRLNRAGVYFVGDKGLFTDAKASKPAIRLKPSDRPDIYSIVGGPF